MWGWGNHDRIFIVGWTNPIKWRRFEQPRLFLDWPSSQTEQLGKKDLDMSSRPRTWWSHWMSSRDHVWRWEKLLEWQPSLEQWFGLYGRVATWRPCKNLQKKHQKVCEKQDSLVWWTSFSSVMSRENQSLLTTCTIPSQWGSKVSSSRVWGTVRIEKFSDILNENSGPQTFQQDNDPEHTAGTVQEWLREDSVNVLEWPNQSLNFTQIKNLWRNMKIALQIKRIALTNPDGQGLLHHTQLELRS